MIFKVREEKLSKIWLDVIFRILLTFQLLKAINNLSLNIWKSKYYSLFDFVIKKLESKVKNIGIGNISF